MYLVIYEEEFEGYYIDGFTACFTEYKKAKIYAKRLNKKLAKKYNVRVEDLASGYTVENIKKGE